MGLVLRGEYPGGYQETPNAPDEPDVLAAGDVVEGVGGVCLAASRRVRRVGWWFVAGGQKYCCAPVYFVTR